jgi:biopolymer transport protein ExbD
MKRTLSSSGLPPVKVNVVPIIDVSLVLVVILLVTAPVLAVSDLPITLPQAASRGAEDDLRVSVTLGRHGEVAVDEKEVNPSLLVPAIRKRIAETKDDVLVTVRADASLPYSSVEEVLHEAREAGAKRIAIATRQGDHVLDGSPRDADALEDVR